MKKRHVISQEFKNQDVEERNSNQEEQFLAAFERYLRISALEYSPQLPRWSLWV